MRLALLLFLLSIFSTTFAAIDDVDQIPLSESCEECCPSTEEPMLIPCLKGLILVGDPSYMRQTDLDTIYGLEIIGLEVCDPRRLELILEPIFLNKPLTVGILTEIKQEIIEYYLSCNYPLVDVRIPEQDITDGVLQLIVIESRVGKIRCVGNCYFSSNTICGGVCLDPGDFIDIDQLQVDIAWLNRNPFRRTEIVFTPGEEVGTTDIELVTYDERPSKIYFGRDDYDFELLGEQRFFAGIVFGNLWDMGHIFSYQFTGSTRIKHLQAHAAQYIAPLPCHHFVEFFGGYVQADSHVDHHIAPQLFHNKGQSWQASFRYRIPFQFLPGGLDDISFGFDVKKTNNSLLFGGLPSFKKPALLTQLTAAMHSESRSDFRTTLFDFEIFWGLPVKWFKNQSEKDFDLLRPGATRHYTYVVGTLENTFTLPYDFAIWTRLEGQLSNANLLPSEQFGLGGYDTVRGYAEREVNGDNGILANIELRSPRISLLDFIRPYCETSLRDTFYLLAFLDYGAASYHEEVKGDFTHLWNRYLLGIGPGLRYYIDPYLVIRLDWGFQLHKTGLNHKFRNRVHFSTVISY